MTFDPFEAPFNDLSAELTHLIESRPGRTYHYLPDLALKMFATQVLQYGRAFERLASGQLITWSFPIARTAFETAEDLAYLAFAGDSVEYDRRGALAHVGGEIAVSKTNGMARAALPRKSLRPAKPERERIGILAREWANFREGADSIVWAAYREARSAWAKGNKRWTLLSRDDTHKALQKALEDAELGPVFASWYDILSLRSHPGLHSPQLNRHESGHQFLTDGDENNVVPEASVRSSLILASYALGRHWQAWDG